MTTDLHARIEHQRALILFLCLLLVAALVLAGVYLVRIKRLQAVQMGMITAAHQRHADAEKLCAAVGDQEYIIRRNLPLVRMSWTAGLREICQ